MGRGGLAHEQSSSFTLFLAAFSVWVRPRPMARTRVVRWRLSVLRYPTYKPLFCCVQAPFGNVCSLTGYARG